MNSRIAKNALTKLKDPSLYILILGFVLPFVFQIGIFPFQKLSMFSEDPSAYKKWNPTIQKTILKVR
jgi:hypothetical protein